MQKVGNFSCCLHCYMKYYSKTCIEIAFFFWALIYAVKFPQLIVGFFTQNRDQKSHNHRSGLAEIRLGLSRSHDNWNIDYNLRHELCLHREFQPSRMNQDKWINVTNRQPAACLIKFHISFKPLPLLTHTHVHIHMNFNRETHFNTWERKAPNKNILVSERLWGGSKFCITFHWTKLCSIRNGGNRAGFLHPIAATQQIFTGESSNSSYIISPVEFIVLTNHPGEMT